MNKIDDKSQQDMESSQQEMVLDDEDKDDIQLSNFDQNAVRQDLEKLKIKLILTHVMKNSNKCTELMQNFDITDFITVEKHIKVSLLVEKLKEIGFPLDQNLVYYYCPEPELFVYCGIDPLPEDIVIDKEDYWDIKQLRIKCKENPISYIHQTMSEDANEQIAKNKDLQPIVKETNSKSRRNNEKKIGFIIEKVVKWRKLYNGITDENGQVKKYSLDEAANEVGIPKKSLDDYLLQIRYKNEQKNQNNIIKINNRFINRFGRKYGFNFNEYKNDKVGQLRQFVRKHKLQHDKPKKRKQKEKKNVQQQQDQIENIL